MPTGYFIPFGKHPMGPFKVIAKEGRYMKSIFKKYYSKFKQLEFLQPIKPAWRNLRRWFIARTTPLPKAPKNTHGNADQGDILDVYFNHKLEAFLNHKDSFISFKIDPKPLVSIIVLTYNKAALLLECLQSVVNHTHDSYEIIIADNASTDRTNELLDRIENAIILRNSENLDFIRGNNAASKHAHGKYLLFLNHDTSVLPGWCDELYYVLETRTEVGAVGAKLIHMDGRLQESGCLVRKDGSTWGYGRSHANPNACEFNHVREVDFCSGAALMVRTELFRTLNGFDERYNPAYFEDVDLCMSIKKMGYKVLVQPRSAVLHRENGNLSGRAFKLCQINAPLFKKKFELELSLLQEEESTLHARDKKRGRNILVMDDYVPDPARGAGMPRTKKILLDLATLGHKVTYIPLTDTASHQATVKELQLHGIEIFHGHFDLESILEERRGYYDTIMVCKPHHAEPMLWRMRKLFPKAHLIYDTEAIIFQRELDRALIEGKSIAPDHLADLKNREFAIMKQADTVLVVSEADSKTVLESLQGTRVAIYGHPIKTNENAPGYEARKNLLFVGGLSDAHAPNVDALEHFLKESWPEISTQLPDCKMIIVGANPCKRIIAAAEKTAQLMGRVEDLQPLYDQARIVICPLRFGAGIALKLAEAMAQGVPSVASIAAGKGFGIQDGSVVAIAENFQTFISEVVRLYSNKEEWEQRQQKALAYAREHFSPEILREELQKLLPLP